MVAQLRSDFVVVRFGWLIAACPPPSRIRTGMRDWWERASHQAQLIRTRGRGYHSLRRQFATDLKTIPLADLAALGGWKDSQTILKCYMQPDHETMRAALANRRSVEQGIAR